MEGAQRKKYIVHLAVHMKSLVLEPGIMPDMCMFSPWELQKSGDRYANFLGARHYFWYVVLETLNTALSGEKWSNFFIQKEIEPQLDLKSGAIVADTFELVELGLHVENNTLPRCNLV